MKFPKSILFMSILALAVSHSGNRMALGQFQAGAAVENLTPVKLPVKVNGGFIERSVDKIDDPLRARCLVVCNGKEKVALVVADSCMIPRTVCDRIKTLAEQSTGIPTNRILVSATHTHSAPSLMNLCLGSSEDSLYVELFVAQVAKCIELAHQRLEPAKFGFNSVDAPKHTFCRRWIRVPGQIGMDPFGEPTIRAMMHPGYQNATYLGPSGPVDSELSLISIRSLKDEPICVMANYSMHYVGGGSGLSADYFGYFCHEVFTQVVNKDKSKEESKFVAIMSQGTAGDLHWMDYSQPRRSTSPSEYAKDLAKVAIDLYKDIDYRADVDIAMSEKRITLGRRMPIESRLAWARQLNEARGNAKPRNQPEVYAQQATWIAENPNEQLVLQAIRIGDVGMTAMPNEVFAVTGLKLKAQSPLNNTFNIELANGAAGYIPPPEQHKLGGYTTWPARTAGLEIEAEPKIVEQVLSLLESVSGKKRRPLNIDLYPEIIRTNMNRVLKNE